MKVTWLQSGVPLPYYQHFDEGCGVHRLNEYLF